MNHVVIRTSYQSPTDSTGARIRVTDGTKSKVVPYPYDFSMGYEAHREAARQLHNDTHLIGGSMRTRGGKTYWYWVPA